MYRFSFVTVVIGACHLPKLSAPLCLPLDLRRFTLYRIFQMTTQSFSDVNLFYSVSGFGDLEVACWPLVPKLADSNPAPVFGFFRAKKSSARLPPAWN